MNQEIIEHLRVTAMGATQGC